MKKRTEKSGLSSFQLKIIAMITMLVDHVGCIFFPQYIILREIGRISFPIFCFLLVEGFFHTSNIWNYLKRFGILALLSEIPFDLVFHGTFVDWSGQNVACTLFLGLFSIWILEEGLHLEDNNKSCSIWWEYGSIIAVVFIMFAAECLHTDYGAGGILMILIFYLLREQLVIQVLAMGVLNTFLMRGVQKYAVFAMLPISVYNGTRGIKLKYVFYMFYPLHLLVLWFIKVYILP